MVGPPEWRAVLGACLRPSAKGVGDLSDPESEESTVTTYTVKRLAWFGMRLWRALQRRKEERAKEKARKGGGAC
jgi:hypothetical protein